jgi:acyl-CoA thioester hydrolase
MSEQPSHLRRNFRHFHPISTRWQDNDSYGHVDSASYYSFFDSAVHTYLIREGGLDVRHGALIACVLASSCDYFAPISFPASIEVGLRVTRLGDSSVQYDLAIFRQHEQEACAAGKLTQVFLDRAHHRSAPIPAQLRSALQALG